MNHLALSIHNLCLCYKPTFQGRLPLINMLMILLPKGGKAKHALGPTCIDCIGPTNILDHFNPTKVPSHLWRPQRIIQTYPIEGMDLFQTRVQWSMFFCSREVCNLYSANGRFVRTCYIPPKPPSLC